MTINDLEIYHKDRVVLFCGCTYKLSKISGKHNRDKTGKKYQKCVNDCVVFKVNDCINEMLHYVLEFRGETEKVNIKIVEHILYVIAHNGSGFDSNIVYCFK